MPAIDDIKAQLVTAGLAEDVFGPLAAAIEGAGLDLVPTGGGSPTAPLESADYEVRGIAGRPAGWEVHSVAIGVIGKYQWIEASGQDAGRLAGLAMSPVFVPPAGGGPIAPSQITTGTIIAGPSDTIDIITAAAGSSIWTFDGPNGRTFSLVNHYTTHDVIWGVTGIGPVVKDMSNGHWYRFKVTAGVVGLQDLGTSLP